ncbi:MULTISPECIES: CHASE4 domain-containing protein [unclassified Pseudoalteromonas]|uniref:CHASE4 domain-containing protein n=2 Tax=unclassified Pseudoalteromonas TaxID=194690 RepID=UPI0009E49E8A
MITPFGMIHIYVENRDNKYITNNFVQDTYTSLNINGIHIYDKQGVLVWVKTLNNSKK